MVRAALFGVAVLAASAAVAAAGNTRHVVAHRLYSAKQYAQLGWNVQPDIVPQDLSHEFHIFLKHQDGATERLTEALESVSSPKSKNYAQHLSPEQVNALVGSPESVEAVSAWLAAHGVAGPESVISYGDRIHVRTTVDKIEALFQSKFRSISHVREPKRRLARLHGEVSVPAELKQHVQFVAGLTEVFDPVRGSLHASQRVENKAFALLRKESPAFKRDAVEVEDSVDGPIPGNRVRFPIHRPIQGASNVQAPCDSCAQMTPQVIRKYYNVSANLHGSMSDENMNSVGSFSETFSAKALAQFGKTIAKSDYPFAIYKTVGPDPLPGEDEGEGDLDVQYIQAMAPNTKTFFWGVQYNFWILQWTVDVYSTPDPPIVHSLSYGYGIEEQCEIASVWCDVLGYNSSDYVTRTNVELQKLGARGVTILVSSGDDGTPGRGNNGFCPIDPNIYCPKGGCAHNSTSCQGVAITVAKEDLVITCVLPLGSMGLGCYGVAASLGLSDRNGQPDASQLFSLTQQLFQKNGINAKWETDSEGSPHLYSTVGCPAIKFSAPYNNGVFNLTGYVFSEDEANIGDTFMDEYPGSSPWVTSVGMTTILDVNQKEQVGSILNGGLVTSGGGFSIHEAQGSYQSDFVKKYFDALPSSKQPPSSMYDRTLRAYPDISLTGERYVILMAGARGGKIQQAIVSGTSASSPTLAGLLTLINEQLIKAGGHPLGFVNPLLYDLARDDPSAYNAITTGDNRCTLTYCCTYGWYAISGSQWNPATGLGTPKFDRLLAYALNAQGLSLAA